MIPLRGNGNLPSPPIPLPTRASFVPVELWPLVVFIRCALNCIKRSGYDGLHLLVGPFSRGRVRLGLTIMAQTVNRGKNISLLGC